MKILVVDDDEMELTAISKKLAEKNYQVTTTVDVVEALTILSDEKIDIIISDVMMPCLSGFTFMTMLKNFYYSGVPFILISSYDQENVIRTAYNLGASYFISKPIDFDQLLLKIDELSHVA
ncbi:MAG TPA: response regulator [Bacteroidia bacterium]|nr:response regulator [Bacteroidia bacterium]